MIHRRQCHSTLRPFWKHHMYKCQHSFLSYWFHMEIIHKIKPFKGQSELLRRTLRQVWVWLSFPPHCTEQLVQHLGLTATGEHWLHPQRLCTSQHCVLLESWRCYRRYRHCQSHLLPFPSASALCWHSVYSHLCLKSFQNEDKGNRMYFLSKNILKW
jgi:hypothetical protein